MAHTCAVVSGVPVMAVCIRAIDFPVSSQVMACRSRADIVARCRKTLPRQSRARVNVAFIKIVSAKV